MIVVLDSGIWISAFQFGGTPQAALDSDAVQAVLIGKSPTPMSK